EDVFRLGRLEDRIDRDADRARLERGQIADREARDVRQVERDAVAALDAVCAQRVGEPTGAGVQITIGERRSFEQDRRMLREEAGGALDVLLDVHAAGFYTWFRSINSLGCGFR